MENLLVNFSPDGLETTWDFTFGAEATGVINHNVYPGQTVKATVACNNQVDAAAIVTFLKSDDGGATFQNIEVFSDLPIGSTLSTTFKLPEILRVTTEDVATPDAVFVTVSGGT